MNDTSTYSAFDSDFSGIGVFFAAGPNAAAPGAAGPDAPGSGADASGTAGSGFDGGLDMLITVIIKYFKF